MHSNYFKLNYVIVFKLIANYHVGKLSKLKSKNLLLSTF